MTGPLYRVGRFCTRRHWPVVLAWLLAVVAVALGAKAAGEQNSDNLSLPGTGSTKAQGEDYFAERDKRADLDKPAVPAGA